MAYDNIKLEKGLYTTGKGFTNSLETLDPSENYKGTSLEGLDAYQRQLKRFDIKVSGADSDCVAKFFSTTDSAALFPEYVARAVRQGISENNMLEKITATVTNIDALDYRALEISSGDSTLPAEINEGAFIPEVNIQTKETLTRLHKRGRMLVTSYEAVKYQKLDIFTIMLKQIGYAIAQAQVEDALIALDDGEEEIISAQILSDVSYTDLIKLWNLFSPYQMTTLICNGTMMETLLNMTEFKDSAAGLNFHATGSMITPFGAELFKVSNSIMENGLLALDKNYALEKVQAGDIATDYDKLIDRQLERATVTSIAGFSKIINDAVKFMNTN